MADIEAFRGFRFTLDRPEDLGARISPPYDMVDSAMVDTLYRTGDYNIIRVIQNKPEPSDTANRDRHRRAAALLESWIAAGAVARDARPCVYVYNQTFTIPVGGGTQTFSRTGVIARVKLVDFSEGIVLPHENTLSGPKDDRLELLEETRFNTELIFGIVQDTGDLHQAIRQAMAGPAAGRCTDANGVAHELYVNDDPETAGRLKALVAGRTVLIADGHHRYETSLNYARKTGRPEDNHVMMTLVSMSDPGLVIRAFHRLVKRNELTTGLTGAKDLSAFFDLQDLGAASPDGVLTYLAGTGGPELLFVDAASKRLFGLRVNSAGRLYVQTQGERMSQEWNSLAVSKINRLCIQGIMRQPLNGTVLHDALDYVNDARDAFNLLTTAPGYVGGFFIRPVTINEIRDIVAKGERMPQKSTNFFPKLYSGLVMNRLGPA